MEDFITGVLVENNEGATYEGRVYDRFLSLRLMDGQVLEIFDPFEPISTSISTGEIYKLILSTLAKSVQFFPKGLLPPPTQANIWQGTVVEPRWRLIGGSYKYAHSYLNEKEWILLSVPQGRLLMNPKGVGTPVNFGDIIQWQNVRFDLCAIL